MNFIKYILIFILGFILLNAAGQVDKYQISGQVTDASTGQTLPFVHVYLKSTISGDVTDVEGNYSLTFNHVPDTLIISSIGYEKIKMPVKYLNDHHYYIPLNPKAESLSEVVITSEPIQVVFKDEQYSVLDYELDGDDIFLLIYRNRRSIAEILLINQFGDTISRNDNLPGKPVALFKDCLDNIHFVSNDWTWEISRVRNKIKFRFPSTTEKAIEVFSDCVTSLGDNIFFQKYLLYGMAVEYYAADKFDSRTVTLATIRDEFKLNLLRKNPGDLAILSSAPDYAILMADFTTSLEGRGGISRARAISREQQYLRNVFYPPVKAPLKRIDENLVIFDFPNSKIRFYEPSGRQFFETPITFHHKNTKNKILESMFKVKDWEDYEVFVDEKKYKAYALVDDKGKFDLNEIDLFSGEVVKTHKLFYRYPEKINIHNGYAYFLFKPYSDWTKKRLYKQRL